MTSKLRNCVLSSAAIEVYDKCSLLNVNKVKPVSPIVLSSQKFKYRTCRVPLSRNTSQNLWSINGRIGMYHIKNNLDRGVVVSDILCSATILSHTIHYPQEQKVKSPQTKGLISYEDYLCSCLEQSEDIEHAHMANASTA
jgi:hypothetical protein